MKDFFSVTIDPLGTLFFRKTGGSSKITPQRKSHDSWNDNREKSFNTFSCKPVRNQNSKQTGALEAKDCYFQLFSKVIFPAITPFFSMELNQS